ncbi:MAG: phosphoribosylformylglycinamidine synthase subunit PurS [Candidatus Methylomirabilaceae bacterium]
MPTARIYVTLKPGVLDAQGDTVKSALETLGFKGVEQVRIGKFMLITLNSATVEDAKTQVEEMCRRLLANPVIEDYKTDVEADSVPPPPPHGRKIWPTPTRQLREPGGSEK